MLKAVEFGLLAVCLLVILGLIVVGPGAYARGGEEGEMDVDAKVKSAKPSTS